MGILGWFGRDRARHAQRGRRSLVPRVEGVERRALLSTATITQTLTLAPTPTNFGYNSGTPAQPLAPPLELFNPALGTLLDVRVSGSANVTSQIKAENLGPSPTTITAGINGTGDPSATNATFEVDGLNMTLTGSGALSSSASVAAYDGNTDYSGPSGVTFPPLVVANSINPAPLTDTASLAFYTASANRTSITPTMSAQALATATAPGGNLSTSVQTTAGATITVSYDYTPGAATIARYGVHAQRTSLVVSLTQAVAATDAQNVNNYQVITPGRDRRFGTGDDVVDPINVANYNAATNTVTLIPVMNLNIHQPYELIISYPGQTPTVIPFNHRNLAGFNYHGGKFFQVVDGHVVR
jgi:hypothetical protein